MNPWTKITNKKGLVFWRDNRSGLLWSPPLAKKYTFDDAIALAPKVLNFELGKFKNRTWDIPTRDEIAVAIANGLLDQIPNMKSFWSASVYSISRVSAWIFYEPNGDVPYNYRFIAYGVRCVGRRKK